MANKWKCLGSLIRKPTKTEKMVARRSARRGGDQRLQWPIFSPEFLPKFRIFLRIIAKISDKILPPKARNHEICDKKERNTLLLWPKWSKRAKNYPKWPQKNSEFLTNSAIEIQKTQKLRVNSEILTPLEPLVEIRKGARKFFFEFSNAAIPQPILIKTEPFEVHEYWVEQPNE